MINIGVIGLGAIGTEHLAIYRRLPNVRVAAVADSRTERAQELADGAAVFDSAAALIGSGLVEAVSLCTPDHLHYADALAVINSGIHLLLEKPISTETTEAEELARSAESSNVTVMPAHTLRFMDRYIAAKTIMSTGQLAARVKGRTTVTFFLGIHDIDAISWITGQRVVAVQAMETRHRTRDGSQAVAVVGNLRLANGGVVQLEAGWGLPDSFPTEIDAQFRLVAERGELAIDIHDQGLRSFTDSLRYPVPTSFDLYGMPQGALPTELATFLSCIERHTKPPITMHEAANAVRVAAALDRAVLTGTTETV
jgi:predicted dehydrogenase